MDVYWSQPYKTYNLWNKWGQIQWANDSNIFAKFDEPVDDLTAAQELLKQFQLGANNGN